MTVTAMGQPLQLTMFHLVKPVFISICVVLPKAVLVSYKFVHEPANAVARFRAAGDIAKPALTCSSLLIFVNGMNKYANVDNGSSHDESYEHASPREKLLASGAEYHENNEQMHRLDYLAVGEKYEVKSDQLMIRELIGQGYYSDVHFGTLSLASGIIPVAVKSPKLFTKSMNEEEREDILRRQREAIRSELEILIDLQMSGGHQNVLKLVGAITTQRSDFCIMTEFCEWGSMDNFLKKKFTKGEFENEIIFNDDEQDQIWKIDRDSSWEDTFEARRENGLITTSDLLWFALQIARAMQFLKEKNIVHRDAALRNVLLKPDFTIKISDFGLSRKLKEDSEASYIRHKLSALPIRYIAPESLCSGRFTIHSEFWSFGILLWELFTFSQTQPYSAEFEHYENRTDFFDFLVEHLSSENRLVIPKNVPFLTQKLIARLWHKDPERRPSFGSCESILKQQLIKSCPKILLNDKTAHVNASEKLIFNLEDAEMNENIILHRKSSYVSVPNIDKEIAVGRSKMEVKITRRKATCVFLLAVVFITIAIAVCIVLYNILNSSNKNDETSRLDATEAYSNTKKQNFVSKTLKESYKKKFKSHNPLYSFLDFEFDMEDGYVPLTLHSETSDEDVSDLDVLLEKAFHDFRLAIVIGDPFSGKTTLLRKIAFDWANIGRFNQYDIILYFEFRYLPDGNYETILDFTQAGDSEFELHKNVNISENRILILVDGYDEKRQSQICNQLDRILNNDKKVNLEFDLMLTSRPSSIIKRKREASFWKIGGFMSEVQQNDYIENHFRKSPEQSLSFNLSEKISAIKSDLEKSTSLRELAKSPMMLTFFCLVQQNMKQITKPALFDAVVKFTIQRFDKKHPEKKILLQLTEIPFTAHAALTDHQATEMVEQYRNFPQIKKIGKLAFDATLERKLVFESNDFEINALATYIATFEGMGLLVNTGLSNGGRASFSYQFMHRSMQEYFSALYFLYWQTDTVQYVDTLLDREEGLIRIKVDHRDFIQMTFDVLMAERNEAALISVRPLFSEIEELIPYATIHLQSQSVNELWKEHVFFQSIMENCKRISHIDIDGMGAAIDFSWTIKLPHDHRGGMIKVELRNFNFVGTNDLILSVNCSDHIQLEAFVLNECKFEPERLRLPVDGCFSQLKTVEIVLTLEMMEELSILPDSRFMPSEWSGKLSLLFDVRSESLLNSNAKRLNNASAVKNSSTLFVGEDIGDSYERSIYRILRIFPRISGLDINKAYSGGGAMMEEFESYSGSEFQDFFKKLQHQN